MKNAWDFAARSSADELEIEELTTGRSFLTFEEGATRKDFNDAVRFLRSSAPPFGSLDPQFIDRSLITPEPFYWDRYAIGLIPLPVTALEPLRGQLRGLGVIAIEPERYSHHRQVPVAADKAVDPTWGLDATKVRTSGATGKGIRIAILDSGIDFRHDAFPTSRVKKIGSAFGKDAQDYRGHGTHIAGIVCGSLPKSGKRYSIAHQADILVYKAISDKGGAFGKSVKDGIEWAQTHDADIAVMALGWPVKKGTKFDVNFERTALMARRAGVCLIALAGNDESRQAMGAVNAPANSPSVMAVASVDSSLRVSWFSCGQVNLDGEVNFAAPGEGILSAGLGNTTTVQSGTSQACAYAAGIAALWLEHERAGQSNPSAEMLQNILSSQIQVLQDKAEEIGRGLVKAPQ